MNIDMNIRINKILEYVSYFEKLKNDNMFLFEEINKIKKRELDILIKKYANSDKVNKIRYEVVLLLNQSTEVDKDIFNKIKEKVVAENTETNILNSYKDDYSIFYSFFNEPLKDEIESLLEDVSSELLSNLNLKNVKVKSQGFGGSRNLGSDRCWFAIYNNKQKDQSTSLQLFFNFDKLGLTYGLYEHLASNKYKSKFTQSIGNIDLEKLYDDLRPSSIDIINDTECKKIWKFSPGEQAKFWNEMFSSNIASIGWGNYDYTNTSAKELTKLNTNLGKDDSKIISYLSDVKIGDTIVAFKDRKEMLGIGKVLSTAKYSQTTLINGSDHYNYVDVEWKILNKKIELKKKVSMDALNEITPRKEEIFNVLGDYSNLAHISEDHHAEDSCIHYPLNQILYGPPGTGKTFNTINKAIEIIEARIVSDHEDRENLKNQFEEYKNSGQIEFVTFHQSYGYEEFVEGIKADLKSDEIKYKIEQGIFKKLVKKAKSNYEDSKKSASQIIKEKTLKQKIELFLTDSLEDEREFSKTKGGIFKIKNLNESTIVIYSHDSNYNENKLELNIDEFYKIIDANVELKTSRQMAKDIFGISNQRQRDTYYLSMAKEFKKQKFDEIHESNKQELLKNYIIIIDEINRGNISKIFGELITLIEPSKRIGANEAIEVKLPNSNESFGVPSNLYIIGTMNTADRSIAQIDTALRRRFEFVEMMPNPELLNDIIIDGIDIKEMLIAINERIEYIYDREHSIGHSYFLPLHDTATKEKLDEIFKVNILPLLAEYFYGDWGDIVEILNDYQGNFIIDKTAKLTYKPKINRQNKVYEISSSFSSDGYKNIYNGLENSDDIMGQS